VSESAKARDWAGERLDSSGRSWLAIRVCGARDHVAGWFMRVPVLHLSIACAASCVVVADTGALGEPTLLSDVREPCSSKASSGTATLSDTEDAFVRILGEVWNGDFGTLADVVGDVDGDGCDDLAVRVTEYDALITKVVSTYVLLYRGPFDSDVFTASEADARIDMNPDTVLSGGAPRSAGDTNLDGAGDLWLGGHLIETPFFVEDSLDRSTASLLGFGKHDSLDVTSGFDADEDGEVDALIIGPNRAGALAYGPLVGDISLVANADTASIAYYVGDQLMLPTAQWVDDLAGTGIKVAVLAFARANDGGAFGWVIDAGGDWRNKTIVAADAALLTDAVSVPDVTGDGVVDFLSGMEVCEGAKVIDGGGRVVDGGREACAGTLPDDGRTAIDADGDGIAEIMIPAIGLYSVISEATWPGPAAYAFPTTHSGDLTGDGIHDWVVFDGEYDETVSGRGEIRIYDGSGLVDPKR